MTIICTSRLQQISLQKPNQLLKYHMVKAHTEGQVKTVIARDEKIPGIKALRESDSRR